MPEPPPAPRTRHDVTSEWLDAALHASGALRDGRVTSLRLEPISGFSGFLADTVRLRPAYEAAEGVPSSLIGKFASQRDETREFMFRVGLYLDEVRFYSDIAPVCQVLTPNCFFAGYDAASQRVGLVLEDLIGWRSGDELAETSLEELRLAIDAMAALHAAFWDGHAHDISEVRVSTGVRGSGNLSQLQAVVQEAASRLDNLSDETRSLLPDAAMSLAEQLRTGYAGVILYLLQERPRTITHGDFRLDNVFYSLEAPRSPVTVIDWQTVCRCNAGLDLGWFLSLSMSGEARRRHEDELIRHYHAMLLQGGVSGYSFEDCRRDYLIGLVNAFWRQVGAQRLLVGNDERGALLRRSFLGRCATAVADHGGPRLLDQLSA